MPEPASDEGWASWPCLHCGTRLDACSRASSPFGHCCAECDHDEVRQEFAALLADCDGFAPQDEHEHLCVFCGADRREHTPAAYRTETASPGAPMKEDDRG